MRARMEAARIGSISAGHRDQTAAVLTVSRAVGILKKNGFTISKKGRGIVMDRHSETKRGNPAFAHKRHTVKFSFACAFSGLFACIKRERNMKIHLAIAALVIGAGVFFRISAAEWLACLAFFALVLGAELMNTAVEAAVDLASPEKSDLAKLAKDTAAAAVLVCSVLAAVAGCVIFLPKLWVLILG